MASQAPRIDLPELRTGINEDSVLKVHNFGKRKKSKLGGEILNRLKL